MILRLLLCLFVFILPLGENQGGVVFSQTQKKKDLETKKQELQKEIDYQNEEMEVCIYLEIKNPIPAGEYIVEAYSDEAEIGRTSFKLK